jgi:hypothetical protein
VKTPIYKIILAKHHFTSLLRLVIEKSLSHCSLPVLVSRGRKGEREKGRKRKRERERDREEMEKER